jgi:hypothetical protein
MRLGLSWFPLTSLRAIYPWCAKRELFYRTAAKAGVVDRMVSTLTIVALVAGVACIATRPFMVAFPVTGLLLLVAPLAWLRERWRMRLHAATAIALLVTYTNLSWPILALIAINLFAAVLIVIEGGIRERGLFKPLHLGNTNIGSARLLRNNVEIAHFFLDTGRRWRDSRIRATMKKADRACRWLAKEGRRFGVRIDFANRKIPVTAELWTAPIPCIKNDYAGTRDFEHFLARQLAAANWPPVEAAGDETPTNYCLMVHVAGWADGRAYASPTWDGHNEHRQLVEYAIVAEHDSEAALAHELLHLFGADDFYFGGRFEKGWYAGQLGELLDSGRLRFLERCVMFHASVPLRELAVDDLTAQKIGWL